MHAIYEILWRPYHNQKYRYNCSPQNDSLRNSSYLDNYSALAREYTTQSSDVSIYNPYIPLKTFATILNVNALVDIAEVVTQNPYNLHPTVLSFPAHKTKADNLIEPRY